MQCGSVDAALTVCGNQSYYRSARSAVTTDCQRRDDQSQDARTSFSRFPVFTVHVLITMYAFETLQGSPVLIRSTPKRYLPSSITSTPYGSGYGSPSGSSGPSSPGSLALDEAEIERELFMDVDKASLAQEEEEERLISNMVRSVPV